MLSWSFLCGLLLSLAGGTGFAQQTTAPAAVAPVTQNDPAKEPEIVAAIKALGDDAWEKRDHADQRLRALGVDNADIVLNKLMEHYVTQDDPEVELRAQDIMREVVIKQIFHQRKGYLGVRLGFQQEVVIVNKVTYRPITIEQVMPNTAAQQAQLIRGDKVIKVDDNLCTPNFGVTQMVKYISAQPPGTKLHLTLWSKGKEVAREVVLRQRPTFPTDPPQKSQQKEFFDRWLKEQEQKARERLGLPLSAS
ncbi:MAG: C-terminal processing protease CtpA/Prc [Candidatus Promineifilaceae bacterium]|jgi:C-terminal processing protease CtpA/Prc